MPSTTPSRSLPLVPRILWLALLMSQLLYVAMLVVPGLIEPVTGQDGDVMGIAAGLLGHPPVVWGAFVAVGMTLTAIRFPTEATFFAPIEQHTGVRVPR